MLYAPLYRVCSDPQTEVGFDTWSIMRAGTAAHQALVVNAWFLLRGPE